MTYRSEQFDTIIEVKVGANPAASFFLHKGALSFYSRYFRGAINGSFAEANSGIVNLSTEDPAVFKRFVAWLYTRKLELEESSEGERFESIAA